MAALEVDRDGLFRLLRLLNRLPREANRELRVLAKSIAAGQAEMLKAAAAAHPDVRVQAQARAIRTRSDRMPVVALGGGRSAGVSGGASVGEVLFGTEFGASQDGPNGWRFPGRVRSGHWAFPALRDHHGTVVREWSEAVGIVAKRWGGI